MLANGMDFHVFGPLSCRRNDLTSLALSNFEVEFTLLQQGDAIFFTTFGNSVYPNGNVLRSGGGRVMASVRETIEWSYKDEKGQWQYIDYKHVLKLNQQPIGKIVFICMLLRNAHVCLNGCQGGEYMEMLPPTLEELTSQGPCAHPLPQSCIWSPTYIPNDYDSDETADEDAEAG